jgi:hypothetical protein
MDTETSTGIPAKDLVSVIETKLYGTEEPEDTTDADVVGEDDDLPTGDDLPDADDTDADEDEEGSDLDDIAEEDLSLAAYLGVDEDKLTVAEDGSVALDTIVDGETTSVPLTELVKSYQVQGHVNNKSIALEGERKEFESTRNEVSTQLKERLEGVANLSKVLEEMVVEDYNGIDWDTLRTQDPAEWGALRQQFAEKAQRVQQAQTLMMEEGKRLIEEGQTTSTAREGEYLKGEVDKMIVNNPGWNDPKVMTEEVGSLRKFAMDSYGFDDNDMKLVTDNRLISLIQDAKKFREGTKQAKVKLEKRVPKAIKPGAAVKGKKQTANARAVKAKRGALRKSGSIQDTANLLVDRM